MSDAVISALALLGQGMAGIFTVLGVIAALVALLAQLDRK